MIFWMGVYSKPFVARMEPSVVQFVNQMTETRESMNAKRGAIAPQAALEQAPEPGTRSR
jgi:hypothetical protein